MEDKLDKIIELLSNSLKPKAILTIDETAEYAEISRSRLLELVNSENTDFPYFRNGKKILVNRQLLDKWLEEKTLQHQSI